MTLRIERLRVGARAAALLAALVIGVPRALNAGTVYAALKATSGAPSISGNLDADFTAALAAGKVTVYANAVRDTKLYGSTSNGDDRWKNFGAVTYGRSDALLYHFDLSLLPRFAAGSVTLAEVQINQYKGNNGSRTLDYVTTHAWSEGNKVGGWDPSAYPGGEPAARGASRAHPNGLNTAKNQNADGGTTQPWQSWGPDSNAFFMPGVDTSGVTRDYKGIVGSGEQLLVYTVTDIVDAWRAGTRPNYGFSFNVGGNYEFHFREAGADNEPVLFIAYTPSPNETLILIK